MRFVVFVVLLAATFLGTLVLAGGSLLAIVGIPAFIMAVFVPIFALLAVWKGSELGTAWRDAFGSAEDQPFAARSLRIWDFAEKACYLAGVIGWLMGMTIALGFAPMESKLDAIATTLVAPIYAMFFALVCRILRERVKQRATD